MRGREVFFKPYRQRIAEMYQQHDSLSPIENESNQLSRHRHYSPYLDVRKTSRTPSPENYPKYNQQQKPMYQDAYRYYDNSPHTKRRSPKKKHRQMNQQIWEHLIQKGKEYEQRRMEAHELKKSQISVQCTFEPNIRKNSRYMVPSSSNFIERNEIWLQNKINKVVKDKQEEIVKGLEECTLAPTFQTKYYPVKPTNQFLLRNYLPTMEARRAALVKRVKQEEQERIMNDPNFRSPIKVKTYSNKSPNKLTPSKGTSRNNLHTPQRKSRQNLSAKVSTSNLQQAQNKSSTTLNRQQFGKIKDLIHNQLKRIDL